LVHKISAILNNDIYIFPIIPCWIARDGLVKDALYIVQRMLY
jgi:hypothetical protein